MAEDATIIKLAQTVGEAATAIRDLTRRFDDDLEDRKEVLKASNERIKVIEGKVDSLTVIASRAVFGAKVVRWVLLTGAAVAGAWAAGGEWINKAMSWTQHGPPK